MGTLVKRGRPLSLERQLDEARLLAKKLQAGAALGWQRLAEEYPNLMELAIALAKGGVAATRYTSDGTKYEYVTEPNVTMLVRLIELLPKVLGESPGDEKSPISGLLENLRANVANIQINVERPLDKDGQRRDDGVGGVIIEGVARPLDGES